MGGRRNSGGVQPSRAERCGRLTHAHVAPRGDPRVSWTLGPMDIDLSALPDDVQTLQRMVRTLVADRTALSEAQAEIERLRLIVQRLQRSQFGQRAERLDDHQLLFGF